MEPSETSSMRTELRSYPEKEKHMLVRTLDRSCIENPGNTPLVYRLPTEVTFEDPNTLIRTCTVGTKPANDIAIPTKIILVVGATGSGKTTLVNGMINYALGVERKDNFRFKVIPDQIERDRAKTKSISQTSWVTAYTLYPGKGSRIPYALTIIDTPGFGDTQGLEKDKELMQKLKRMFESEDCRIDSLHAVCFVTQSPLERLTTYQKYVFDGILSIFGVNIKSNIFMMLTFADGKKPPVLEAIKEAELPYAMHFKFNNSAIFPESVNEREEGDEQFDEMFWRMGMKSFQNFFEYISTKATPVSLCLTVNVLDQREKLQSHIAGLHENIKRGTNQLDQIYQTMSIVKEKEMDINRSKDFMYTVEEVYPEIVDKPEGTHVTNCSNCARTCHDNCAYAEDKDKAKCIAMDAEGNCEYCQPTTRDKCPWYDHFNMKYIFVFKTRTVQKRSDELYKEYQFATNEKIKAEELMRRVEERFETIQAIVLAQISQVRECLLELSKIALKPNPISTIEYIEQLVESEKRGGQEGWQKRVEMLEKNKEMYKRVEQISREKNFDPFSEARQNYGNAMNYGGTRYWEKVGKMLARYLK